MGLKSWFDKIIVGSSEKVLTTYFVRRIFRSRVYELVTRRGLEIIYFLIFFSLASGILNTILEGSSPNFAFSVVIPNRSVQTWSEVVINLFSLTIGSIGAYLLYASNRPSATMRSSSFMVFLGLASLLFAASIGFYMIQVKFA